ncbi:hypothetical protein DFA_04578 [Cavenderia fasciculata]|uniref:TRAF-type domain-containing protein n=1 Tax=Cavenderia fasciculata TaxID=261658 RepID=F4PPY9_CACFS|nr:uncharacterized protein DFA_04578 [Cavenderia fasciculata]EGG22452.1 hypothetical protein DFA_04578 [Cavenderia fasciculata]|eukprot:XP_004360303.1 hypothetical protein DFA_04578 [Cavenderia fasciculata]
MDIKILIFKNRYIFKKIIKERNELYKTWYWKECLSRPLHLMIANGEFDMLKYSLSKYKEQHFILLSFALQRSQTSSSATPIQPIDAAAFANRLDIAIYLHNYFSQEEEESDRFTKALIQTSDAINYAARNLNFEMVKFLTSTVNLNWNKQAILSAINPTVSDGFDDLVLEERGLEIIKYLMKQGRYYTYRDNSTSPIYQAIHCGKKKILEYLVGVCILDVAEFGSERLLGTPPIQNRAYHCALRSGDLEMIDIMWAFKSAHHPGDQNKYHESLLSAIASNKIETVNHVIAKFPSPPPHFKHCAYIASPFLPNVALSDQMLDYIVNHKDIQSLIQLSIDPYIKENRIDTITKFKNLFMVFGQNVTDLVEQGNIRVLKHLITNIGIKMGEGVSIVSAIEAGNPEILQFVYENKIAKSDPSREDKQIKQSKIVVKSLWYHSTRKQQIDGSGRYLECLKFALDTKIVEVRHILNALVYWNGDKDLFNTIPQLLPLFQKLHPKKLIESPVLTNVQLYSNSFTERQPFSHGVKELIEISPTVEMYYKKECDQPLGDWACESDNLELVQYLVSLGNPNLFTKKAIDICLYYNKSCDVLQYLSSNVFPIPLSFGDQMLTARFISLDSLQFLFPAVVDWSTKTTIVSSVNSLEHAYKSQRYQNIYYALQQFKIVSPKEKPLNPEVTNRVTCPVRVGGDLGYWQAYPIYKEDQVVFSVESSITLEERLVNQDYADFTCYLCLGLVNDTRQCSIGHIACFECIKPLTEKEGNKCHCGEPINLQSLSRNLVANNRVYCANHFRLVDGKWEEYLDQQGCNEITTIEQSESHQKSCPLNKYKCKHDGCDAQLVKVELDVHEEECVHQLVECYLCQETLKSLNMSDHLLVMCPEVNEDCLNGCGDTYPRKTRDDHFQTCPDQIICCPFGDEICKEKDKRKYMDAHAQASWHIAQLVIKTNQNNKKLKEENDKLNNLMVQLVIDKIALGSQLNNLIGQLDKDKIALESQIDLCIKKKSKEWIIPSDPNSSGWQSDSFKIRGCTFYFDLLKTTGAMGWYVNSDKPAVINYTIEVTEKDGLLFTEKKMGREIKQSIHFPSMSAFQRKSETNIKLTIGVLSYTK